VIKWLRLYEISRHPSAGILHMRLQYQHAIALPRAAVFAFHENPENINVLHRGWSAVRTIHHDGNVKPASRTWIEATFAGILPVVLGFEHTLYEPPFRFAERQIHGPFQRFLHEHQFDEIQSATVVRDILDVELPAWYGGESAMRRLIAPRLNRIFALRCTRLSELALGGVIPLCVGGSAT
jgi:ligand-binding SRPBCC domain-containing protein